MLEMEKRSPFALPAPCSCYLHGPKEGDPPWREASLKDVIGELQRFCERSSQMNAAFSRARRGSQLLLAMKRDADLDLAKRQIQTIVGIDRLRTYALLHHGAELSAWSVQQVLRDLIRECNLPVSAAERLLVDEAIDHLEAATGQTGRTPTGVARKSLAGTQPHGTAMQQAKPRQQTRGVKRRGKEILIAALTAHHQYQNGSCLSLEPMGNNELARRARVSRSTASAFFQREFGGYEGYFQVCADKGRLIGALRLLNGEVTPRLLLGDADTQVPSREEDED